MTNKEAFARKVNTSIGQYKESGDLDTNLVSDGYHSFGELYEHRIELYIRLCKCISSNFNTLYEQTKHSSVIPLPRNPVYIKPVEDGWFILGLYEEKGKQITYHLPKSKYEECKKLFHVRNDVVWDGHTSKDVLERLKQL